ncbi:MAG TPA: CbiX/SirB N-terminal domain-containing protein [Burkholderiaceae bacterium]|nr:CbiX/SirB N-terminal domain-containing protein [Burkholderiaceae bacterium]
MSTALFFFAHGSRDAQWCAPVERIAQRARAEHAGAVRIAFLEHSEPSLADACDAAIAAGASRIVVVPLFIAAGAHLREDLPRLTAAVARRHPGVELRVAEAAGEAEIVQQALVAFATRAASIGN